MKHNALLTGLLWVAIAALGLPAVSAAAEGGWHTSGEIYLWMADANVTTTEGQEVEAEFDDVIDELELGFMGTLATRKDRWSWFGDLIFVAIDARETTPVSGPGIPGPIDADLKFEQDVLVITAGGGYSMSESDSHRVDFAFGARYFDLETDIGVDLGVAGALDVSDSSNVLDAFIGIKGYTDLSDRWYLGYYADVGAGDSDLAWQALVDFNYRFSKLDFGVGYRILEWQFDGKGLLDDFRISGPYAGLVFNFD